MEYLQKFDLWKENSFFDLQTQQELNQLSMDSDAKEIEDRFYRDLEFGTGGLRGVMAAGTNRMNRYTVGKATTGFGNYLKNHYTAQDCETRGVVIAFDTRNNSKSFAKTAADVLTALGVKVYLFTVPAPTPTLSFAVKHLGAMGGIVLTASHNPKEYNGYKVYDEHGCQLVVWQAKEVGAAMDAITDYTTIQFAGNDNLLTELDCTDAFVDAVLTQSVLVDAGAKSALKVIYTPLHGAGNIPVRKALARGGFDHVLVVPEQEQPDGDFPTVKSPNPEERSALAMGLALGEATKADIVLGTDPDCDRVGVGIRTAQGKYELLTGNQIGALLMDYMLSHRDFSGVQKPAVVNTIVTSALGAEIAKSYGLAVFSTLTGFKFIGEKITQFEQATATGNLARAYTFVLGYEESYGYLVGTHARDKDAVVSSLLICEMAAEYKSRGITLLERLGKLYAQYGYYRDALDSFTLKGKEGLAQIQAMMARLRKDGAPFGDLQETQDYANEIPAETGFGTLPTSDVLKYSLADGSWVAIRPSGTEPKIKIYYSVKAADVAQAELRLAEVRDTITTALGLN